MKINISNKVPPARALEAFVVAVESDSFEAAANRLNRGKDTFSKQILQLEEHVGAKLLIRATRGLSQKTKLTPEGLVYYERARQAVKLLAPDLPGDPVPKIFEAPDFDVALKEADQDIQEFWEKSSKLDFDYSLDDNPTKRQLRDRSLFFVKKGGEWFFHFVGPLAPIATVITWEVCKNLVGKNASRCIYTGAYSAYDYEVSKVFNKVHATGKPSISRIEAHLRTPDGQLSHEGYSRIAVPGTMDGVDVVVIRTVIHDWIPFSQLTDTISVPMEMSMLSRIGKLASQFFNAWKKTKGYWEELELQEFHDRLLLVRQLPGPIGTLKIVHIGDNHGSVKQFGELWKKETKDEIFTDDPLGSDYNSGTQLGYNEVFSEDKPRLDLICANGSLAAGHEEKVAYFRLLVRVVLEDGEPGVANMVFRVKRFADAIDPETCVEELLSGPDVE